MMTSSLILQPIISELAFRSQPQLCYMLLIINAQSSHPSVCAVNWALVADASRSMRIPIISETQFRDLVRTGGAQEVLVDGVPVWQLTGPVPPDIKSSAPSALDYTARALHSVVEQLDSADRFTLIACAEKAQTLTSSTSGADRATLVQSIGKLKGLRLGEATNLAQGLQLGLAELARGRIGNTAVQPVERLLLLTDGFTQHPDECLALARQAAAEGVAISTLGLGGEFQDDLLMGLADISGGRAVFLRRADEIPHAVADELASARSVVTRAVTLKLTLSSSVSIRHITRLSPALAPLEATTISPAYALHLGDIEDNVSTTLLLELLAPPAPQRHPATEAINVRLAQAQLSSGSVLIADADLVVSYTTTPSHLPAILLDAAARANAVRMQRRALVVAASGDHLGAAALLRTVAQRLHTLGETALAERTLDEAIALEQNGRTTGLSGKELTYGTRRLGTKEG